MPTNVSSSYINPAKTHTVEEFINLKYQDDMTYRNLSILDKIDDLEMVDHCLIYDYLDEIVNNCESVSFTAQEYNKYKYAPDLLAYDLYGSTQLDFIILFANDMIDPKEFNLRTIKLPYRSVLNKILSDIYNANAGYIDQNRSDYKIYN